jgi:molybdenum ABC transporter molybdate-binding protein
MYSPPRRRGAARLPFLAFLASAVSLLALVAVLGWDVRTWLAPRERPKPVTVYCAAALKSPLEEIARDYERECGVPIQLQFGASHSLLVAAELSGRGDLYLPADASYLRVAREKGLLAEELPLARLTAVLAVRKGNPLGIRSLDDIVTKNAKLAQADPDAAAVGHVTREALHGRGLWEKLRKHTTTFTGTVTEAANAVALGSVDVAVVWDATVKQYAELEPVPVPVLAARPSHVALAVLKTSEQPAAALRFARYVAARDKGLKTLGALGYDTVRGDDWADDPEARLLGAPQTLVSIVRFTRLGFSWKAAA